jgi:hypothetical protein
MRPTLRATEGFPYLENHMGEQLTGADILYEHSNTRMSMSSSACQGVPFFTRTIRSITAPSATSLRDTNRVPATWHPDLPTQPDALE